MRPFYTEITPQETRFLKKFCYVSLNGKAHFFPEEKGIPPNVVARARFVVHVNREPVIEEPDDDRW